MVDLFFSATSRALKSLHIKVFFPCCLPYCVIGRWDRAIEKGFREVTVFCHQVYKLSKVNSESRVCIHVLKMLALCFLASYPESSMNT